MALIFTGNTKCRICGEVLQEDDDICGFPAFLSNPKDVLYFFSDGAFHRSCAEKHPLGRKVMEIVEEVTQTPPAEKICEISGKPVDTIENFMYFGVLTSDEKEELYKFNFVTLNKRYLSQWKRREEFIRVATKFRDEGKWQEHSEELRYFDKLIEEVAYA